MRLIKLVLQNWRGVQSREIRFAEGITVVEGPNEIGKSTIVEALRMLFNEMDSSAKKTVRAIQPVGQDVGSRVEVELHAGEHHFIYAKTYNKSRETTLDVLAPSPRQLTSRDAHQAVEEILAQSVDMTLWHALLVDQGEKIAPARLQDSTGLARALDEAAGTSTNDAEDTDLFSAVQSEYERYFTFKSGKPRPVLVEAEADFQRALSAVSETAAALAAVEEDAARRQATAAEVQRMRGQLPKLQQNVIEYERQWQIVRALSERVEAKRSELHTAQRLQQSAVNAHEARAALRAELAAEEEKLATLQAEQAPLREATVALGEQLAGLRDSVQQRRDATRAAQAALRIAEDDARYLHDAQQVTREVARVESLQRIDEQLRTHRAVFSARRVDDEAINAFREADRQLAMALAARDTAATAVSITAHRDLAVRIDGETVSLGEGDEHRQVAAATLTLGLPGVADIEIVPSRSAAQLQQDVESAQAQLAALATRYQVENLQQAVLANAQRADAQREISRLKVQQEQVLEQQDREELNSTLNALQEQCARYLAERTASSDLPSDLADATSRVEREREALKAAEAQFEAVHKQEQAAHNAHQEKDTSWRHAENELAARKATVAAKRERLASERSAVSDEVLVQRAEDEGAAVETLRLAVEALEAELSSSSPQAAEALLSNAREVLTRLGEELQQQERELAVLDDRLQNAQADGRFEANLHAQQAVEDTRLTLESVRRRADSAALLWQTLNKHRDAARESYVRPLKEAIERLGAIVFGNGFEVDVGDDWSVVSRTQAGTTLGFDDLSVGAKEQLGILVRLAAAQIVSKHGGVPLIIDDALGFSDPSRLETMGAAIAAAGKHCQIIILTCTPGRFTNVGNAQLVRLQGDIAGRAPTDESTVHSG